MWKNKQSKKCSELLNELEEELEYHCSIKLMSHQCEESKCENREKSWCCSPKEYTPCIQVLSCLSKHNERSWFAVKSRARRNRKFYNQPHQYKVLQEKNYHHTVKCATSADLVSINQLEKSSSQPYIFRVRMCVKSSPVLLILGK